jgi:hypothetical protein
MIRAKLLRNRQWFTAAPSSSIGEQHLLLDRDVSEQGEKGALQAAVLSARASRAEDARTRQQAAPRDT